MKINGMTGSPVKATLLIPRGDAVPLKLTVHAIPLGAEERALEIFPVPTPPMKAVIDKKPKHGPPIFARDDRTGQVILKADESDPEYKAKQRKHNLGFQAFIAYHGLKADPNVTFETSPALEATKPEEFYLAIVEELKGSGLAMGDLILITEKVLEISNLSKDAVKRAKDDFLLSTGADNE